MSVDARLKHAQETLVATDIDGWLLYDFRKTNDLACRFLGLAPNQLLTRRLFYWIPHRGNPIKLLHRIEAKSLDHLPGDLHLFSSWQELEHHLALILKGACKVAMEYSPRNAIPYVSKVDAGTIDLIRSFDIEVVSSADLLQAFTSQWDDEQLSLHLEAANVLDQSVNKAWQLIASSLKSSRSITEGDVQAFLLNEFEKNQCFSDDPPICAVNKHSADPHYTINQSPGALIKAGDFVLIDLWCKRKAKRAVYADITRVAVAASKPSEKQQKIFEIVRAARDSAMQLISTRLSEGLSLMGWEVDLACRQTIDESGYGKYFTHRTGHNIGEKDHGDGANIDNFETKDSRRLLPKTCFSIEPGIYLPDEFGVRLEHNVYIEADSCQLRVTAELQKEIVCLL